MQQTYVPCKLEVDMGQGEVRCALEESAPLYSHNCRGSMVGSVTKEWPGWKIGQL